MAKRAIDIVVGCLLLVAAAPVIAVLALAVCVTSPGPVFYRQVRIGRGGVPFRIWKLRTMVVQADADLDSDPSLRELYLAYNYKIPSWLDPRVTPLGRLLRRSSLDELPQLVNVVRGDMSLVGPRPVVAGELDHYGDVGRLYRQVRPGITGYWQVKGRSQVRGSDRVALERHYLEHASLWLDAKILAWTVPAVIFGRGAT